MLVKINENLHRQYKAVELLFELLKEEFSYLRKAKPQEVSRLQFSIQDLMRQITSERLELKAMVKAIEPKAKTLTQIVDKLSPPHSETFAGLIDGIDGLQQECARQAEKNNRLAFVMLDQANGLTRFIQEKVTPVNRDTYGRNGRFAKRNSGATIMAGRL